jgi:hypothetical protein
MIVGGRNVRPPPESGKIDPMSRFQFSWKGFLISVATVCVAVGIFLAVGSYYAMKGVVRAYLESEALGDKLQAEHFRVSPSNDPVIRAFLLDGEYYDNLAVQTGKEEPFPPPDNSFRTWPILQSKRIASNDLAASIQRAIEEPRNFGGGGAFCFNPGLGISIGEGDEHVDAVICIGCEKFELYEPDKKREDRTLSAAGKKEFARLYAEIFPEASKTARPN